MSLLLRTGLFLNHGGKIYKNNNRNLVIHGNFNLNTPSLEKRERKNIVPMLKASKTRQQTK
jgi:hypothetical protein